MYVFKNKKKLYKNLITLLGLNYIFLTKQKYISLSASVFWFVNSCFFRNLRLTKFLLLLQTKKQQILYPLDYYKLIRLKQGLPLRGQRTHTNAQTVRLLNKSRFKR